MNKNKPAFPQVKTEYSVGGLTKLEYFAAKAMQGLCANPAVFAHNERCGWKLVNCEHEQLINYCFYLSKLAIAESERINNEHAS